MAMRNKMLNLRYLDLSEADIVASAYEYYSGCHTEDNIFGSCSFYNLENLKSVKLPNAVETISAMAFSSCKRLEEVVFGEENTDIEDSAFAQCNLKSVTFKDKLKVIGSEAFTGNANLETIELGEDLETIYSRAFKDCSSISSVTMGQNLKTIGSYAFSECSKLKKVIFSPTLESIGTYAFQNCRSLENIMLLTSLQVIGNYAFTGCNSLKNVRIPASITQIGNYAFNTPSITDIYTWTIEPTNINQNTFHSDLYRTTTLHVPETSSYLYYWDTQWSQFMTSVEFNEPYTYFYLKDKDLIEDKDTNRIEGENGDNPDADINAGSGLIVEGDSDQKLGDTNLVYDGEENSGSIIGGSSNSTSSGDNVNIDNLVIKITIRANRWYFFAFPFDIALANIEFDGQYVWRYYDGEYRAVHGNGAWKPVEETTLSCGKGYIFQGSKDGTLTINIGQTSIGARDKVIELINHASANLQNASWNLVGNPYTSYYSISDMDYSSPITVWNGSTYTAYNPLDDDATLHPFQAFFVQKPEENTNIGFPADKRITKNQRDDKEVLAGSRARREAKARKARPGINRQIINIEISDGQASDMTRVVFNQKSLLTYEINCDASKFMSQDAPQLYTMDAENVKYSINERPEADGIVRLGFIANHSGEFTISASRIDCQMWLKDLSTDAVIDLTNSEYTFSTEAGTFEDRFILSNNNFEPTALTEIKGDEEAEAIYYDVNGMRLPAANSQGITIVKRGNTVEKVLNK